MYIKLCSALNSSRSAAVMPQKKYKVEDLQKKMNKSRSKIAQFLAEFLKEQELEHKQVKQKVYRDSSKYLFECQLASGQNYY
jgi:predicted extracellular nuclease